ncbi:MAG TPA: histidine kinase [Marmoricola sp.]|nr:histidine kinase [Marmoricola sp.]
MERLWSWLRRDWWVFLVLFISLVGTLKRDEHGYAQPTVLAAVLILAAVLPLFWRTSRPELAVLVNGVAVAIYFGATFADGPVYLSVFLALFALTLRRPPRVAVPYAAVAIVAIVIGELVREIRVDQNSTLGSIGWTTWFVAVAAAAAAVGSAARNRRETRTEQVRRTATEERLRMAQDLHDGVGHGLAVIAMQAGVALHVLDRDPTAARRSLEAIRDTSKESLDSLRAELLRLSPAAGGPAPRKPRNNLADLGVLAARVRAGGVHVDLQVETTDVPGPVGEVAYVVVQESLTNVLRHADATSATVLVRRSPSGLDVTVTDDGRASSTRSSSEADGHGLGIPGMRSRVEALGGTLEAGPRTEGGFRVRAVVPVSAEEQS